MAMELSRISRNEWFNEVFEPFFNSTIDDLMYEKTFFQDVPLYLKESVNNYQIDMEVPGMSKKDIKIELEEGVLTVQGKCKSNYSGNVNEKTFYKTYALPKDAKPDKIKAVCKNGILHINIPKIKRKTKTIPISANDEWPTKIDASPVVKTTWWQRIKNQLK